ncbi:hypothetical protein F2Q70_00004466 [Brassica cretica]|uniref:Uncharacterized protein n=1 Tax=Brassica cretica TaxID=69181 RepID=A0A8S9G1J7_BRACR|nr:hypothetical protein F2Q68_00021323 [Brassica cretica]KAF2573380.1 hypothetical protein F2Q70_00004466 [Brassica cretica]
MQTRLFTRTLFPTVQGGIGTLKLHQNQYRASVTFIQQDLERSRYSERVSCCYLRNIPQIIRSSARSTSETLRHRLLLK